METALDPEATENVRQRLGSERTQGKHTHTDVTKEHECQNNRMSEQIMDHNKRETQTKTRQDSEQVYSLSEERTNSHFGHNSHC